MCGKFVSSYLNTKKNERRHINQVGQGTVLLTGIFYIYVYVYPTQFTRCKT